MTSTMAIIAALLLSQQPGQYDTVILNSGGVLRGTVIENVPGADLVLLMPDGTTRTIPRSEIARLDWAAQPPPPPAAAPPPPPPYPAPPAPPPVPLPAAQRGPLELGVWLSGAFPTGTLDGSGTSLSSTFSPQLLVGFEASWRVADPLELGVYLRLGGGEARGSVESGCIYTGGRCDVLEIGVGFFPRWSFAPRAALNPWVQLGLGYEYLTPYNDWAGIDYTGWEVGAWAGLDVATAPFGALGFFAGARWGQFTSGSPYGGLPMPWGGSATHGWIDLGVRLAWWP